MNKKTREVEYKLFKDELDNPTGEIEAVVSAFGNVDLDGDRIIQGAFDADLKNWKASGDPIPMIWSHDWSNPMSHIGEWYPEKSEETSKGLRLVGKVDIGVGNPVADQAFRLLKGRRIKEFSVALDIEKETVAKDGATELQQLRLIEAGPCLKGANPMTELVSVKNSDGDNSLWESVRNMVNAELRKAFDQEDGYLWAELKAGIQMIASDIMTKAEEFDEGQWDGDSAMSACVKSPNPAAAFAKVCAGKTESDPTVRDGWRLPHHMTPDSPPNIQGVKAALFREPQAPIVNHGAAEAHLQAHLDAYEAYLAAKEKAEEAAKLAEQEEVDAKALQEAEEAKQAAEDEAKRKLDLLLLDEILEHGEE